MAIIWMDGPDHYGSTSALLLNGVYASANSTALEQNSGPGGVGTAFKFGNPFVGDSSYLRKVLPGARAMVGTGMRWYYDSLGANRIYTFLDQFSNAIGWLETISTGALRYRLSNGGVVWQSDPVIVSQSWQHIECAVNFDLVAGRLRVGVDSVTIVDLNGIVTLRAGEALCAQVAWQCLGPKARDMYIWDASGDLNNAGMQGDRQVTTSYATADTGLNDWVPSAGGSGWPLISNVPPNDAQYISANATDLESEFVFSDIDTDITSISAVMVVARLWKSDAGLATVQLQTTSAGTLGQGVEKPLSTNKVFYASIFEKDPHTAVKWLPNAVNLATYGLKRVD